MIEPSIKTRFQNREDTISSSCKDKCLRFKLDIRLLLKGALSKVDRMTGEIAAKATKGKLYKDRLKSIWHRSSSQ